jgi:hypothetical protein
MTTWTETDLAYFAGIIDGEGCFCLHNPGNHRFSCQLHIGNTSPQLMEWIQAKFGGKVNAEKRNNLRHKPVFRWYANADDLDELITAVYPYLVVKRAQADLILAYRRTLAPKPYRDVNRSTRTVSDGVKIERSRIHGELQLLNKRGIA